MKRAENTLPDIRAKVRGDALGVAADPEALEAVAEAVRRRRAEADEGTR